MAAFVETLETEWSAARIPKAEFRRMPMDITKELIKGQITGHKKSDLKKGELFEILQILYVKMEPLLSIQEKI